MRALMLALLLMGLAAPSFAQEANGITILRGASAPPPPPVVEPPPAVVRERTIVEYHYVPTYVPVYFLPAPRIVSRRAR